jgi:hypothetical protein
MLVPAESKRGPRKWRRKARLQKLSDQQERRDFVATASSKLRWLYPALG